MSGTIYLPTPGDYTIHPDAPDRYAVEVYEPEPAGALPTEAVPQPFLTDADNREITTAYRLASLEAAQRQHASGQDWADQQAVDAANRERRQRMDDQLRNSAFGGGG
jgi:hypothetical protein